MSNHARRRRHQHHVARAAFAKAPPIEAALSDLDSFGHRGDDILHEVRCEHCQQHYLLHGPEIIWCLHCNGPVIITCDRCKSDVYVGGSG